MRFVGMHLDRATQRAAETCQPDSGNAASSDTRQPETRQPDSGNAAGNAAAQTCQPDSSGDKVPSVRRAWSEFMLADSDSESEEDWNATVR